MESPRLEDVLDRTAVAVTALEQRLAHEDRHTQAQLTELRVLVERSLAKNEQLQVVLQLTQQQNQAEFQRIYQRFDQVETKADKRFLWLVGIQVATLLGLLPLLLRLVP